MGSAGAWDAHFIQGITRTAIECWRPAAVVLDLSELVYEWADEMDLLLDVGSDCHVKSAVVVGPRCAPAIATLLWGVETSCVATEADFIFVDVEEAWDWVRQRAG